MLGGWPPYPRRLLVRTVAFGLRQSLEGRRAVTWLGIGSEFPDFLFPVREDAVHPLLTQLGWRVHKMWQSQSR